MRQPSLYWYCDGVCASALCCHLQAILQAVWSTLTNLQDNGAKFLFFITNLRFSFDSPLYYITVHTIVQLYYKTVTFNFDALFYVCDELPRTVLRQASHTSSMIECCNYFPYFKYSQLKYCPVNFSSFKVWSHTSSNAFSVGLEAYDSRHQYFP